MEYARNLVGLMLSLDVVYKEGKYVCENVKVIPTVTYFVYTPSKRLEDRTDLCLYLLSDFTDDLAALTWAIYMIAKCITPSVKAQAAAKCREWFGDFDPAIVEDYFKF